MRSVILPLCAVAAFIAAPAWGQPHSLEDVLRLAKAHASAIQAIRSGASASRAEASGGALLLPDNTELAVAGRRRGERSFADEYELALNQPLSGLFTHSRRQTLATASSDSATLSAEAAEGAFLLETADAFLVLADAERRVSLAREILEQASLVEGTLRARFESGDVALIDLNLARAEKLRASADLADAGARATEARAVLVGKLGPATGIGIEVLDDRLWKPAALTAGVTHLPQVRALDRKIEAASSSLRLSTPFAASEWSLELRVGEEEGDNIFEAGIGVTLPIFARRQYASAVATAQIRQVESEREALVGALGRELSAVVSAYADLYQMMQSIDRELIPLLEENVQLANESWEAGRIGLVELLLIRRELLDTRHERSERWLRTRQTEVRLRFLTGDLP